MTPAEHIAARATLGLSQAAEAELLGIAVRTVERWEAGPGDVPTLGGLVMHLLVEAHHRGAIDPMAELLRMAA